MSEPTLIVEAGFGGDPNAEYLFFDDTTRGKLNTGKLAPNFVGTDITADVLAISTRRGRQRLLEAYSAGTCTITLDNTSGNYDPNNLSGTYVSAGVSLVKPMVRVRVRAEWNGTMYDLFHGFADSWNATYPAYGLHSVVQVRATDAFKVLARYEPGAASGSAGASEDSGARIGRILDAAGWNDDDRDIDVGDSALQATTLADNALSECQSVALSEGGYFFVAGNGKVTFRNRHSRVEDTRSTVVQAEFDDDGTNLPYADIEIANDDDLIKNTITATRTGGSAQQAADATSVADFLTRTYNVTGMWLETDTEVGHWAEWVLSLFKEYESRVESLQVLPHRDDALWPVVLGSEFGDLMLVHRRPVTGDDLSKYVFLEGVDHTIEPGSRWSTLFRFSSATEFFGQWMFFDAGEFDTAQLAPY